jgi:hypothetical protein
MIIGFVIGAMWVISLILAFFFGVEVGYAERGPDERSRERAFRQALHIQELEDKLKYFSGESHE